MGKAASIESSDQTGRLGVMYVRALLAQAGVMNTEVQGGEDHLAVDLACVFPVGPVTVQVKTGTKSLNKDGSVSVSTTAKWRAKWKATKTPVYLVYVRLPKPPPADWIEHPAAHTVLHAHAYWGQVNNVSAATVKLPKVNRLTAATFDQWVEDFEAAFGKAVSA